MSGIPVQLSPIEIRVTHLNILNGYWQKIIWWPNEQSAEGFVITGVGSVE